MAYIKLTIAVLILSFGISCSRFSLFEDAKGRVAPRMAFKTASSEQSEAFQTYSFFPPQSVIDKAASVMIRINASDGEHFSKEVDFKDGRIVIDNVSEGEAYFEIEIFDDKRITLMTGNQSYHVDPSQITTPTINMHPVIPNQTPSPFIEQICDSMLKITFRDMGIMNNFVVSIWNNDTYTKINEYELFTSDCRMDINKNHYFIDSTTVFPGGVNVGIRVIGKYSEGVFTNPAAQSDVASIYWQLGSMCNTIIPTTPNFKSAIPVCKSSDGMRTRVELRWSQPDDANDIDAYDLFLESYNSLTTMFEPVEERRIYLWKEYQWSGYDYFMNVEFPYPPVTCRYSIVAVKAGQRSGYSRFVDFYPTSATSTCQ